MASFVDAVKNQEARTANGMKARKSTSNACVDLFFKAGASRNIDIIPDFVAAFVENKDVALRIAAWVRDIRGGAGERQVFRNILGYLVLHNPTEAVALMRKIPELGRWDDLLIVKGSLQKVAFDMIGDALKAKNGLCAKWMPRKGEVAQALRKHLGLTPKGYRKTLVELTRVVETQMCKKAWDSINFSQVPSVAASRYKTAFYRNTPNYAKYVEALVKGDDPKVKVNASAIFPHDVLKGRISYHGATFSKTELDFIQKQWDYLPNYVNNGNVLPIVDVSGSMTCPAGRGTTLTCLEVAVSLGLYLADKNTGKFADTFMTFSSRPELLHLKGNINQKIDQMVRSNWTMSTDLHAAFNKILKTAIDGNVPQDEMPKMVLILSDMQFNSCVQFDDSAIEMIKRKYDSVGYTIPQVVFWNINASNNVPVKFNEKGVALVSGFSPAIVEPLVSGDFESFTPEAIMLKTVMVDRYSVL
jgi:hypothetical protein